MTIHLPEELECSLRAEVSSGHFPSVDEAMAEAVRLLLLLHRQSSGSTPAKDEMAPDLGSIGAMRDAADELDEIVADAMRQRREDTWRVIPGE